MIRAVVICPDPELAGELKNALAGFRNVDVTKVLLQYPNEAKLRALLRTTMPEVVFLSVASIGEATEVARRIEAAGQGTPVVAIDRTCDPAVMLKILRAGLKDFLSPPFEAKTLSEMLARVETVLAKGYGAVVRDAPIFAFFPAKAGVGATTVALNVSLTLTRRPNTRSLLVDLDLNNGLVGFMLSVNSQFSITDAAENAADMDETLWSKIVSQVGNLDVLPVGAPRPGFRIENAQISRILEFARRHYDAICVDLSGMMEKYSVEALHQAKQIFLISTPEVPSLHLTCAKLEILRGLGLEERVSIIVNRAERSFRKISLAEIESIFKHKIFMTLPNAYETARQAGMNGKPVGVTSELGLAFSRLAQSMVPGDVEPLPESRRSLLDVFRSAKGLPEKADVAPAGGILL